MVRRLNISLAVHWDNKARANGSLRDMSDYSPRATLRRGVIDDALAASRIVLCVIPARASAGTP